MLVKLQAVCQRRRLSSFQGLIATCALGATLGVDMRSRATRLERWSRNVEKLTSFVHTLVKFVEAIRALTTEVRRFTVGVAALITTVVLVVSAIR